MKTILFFLSIFSTQVLFAQGWDMEKITKPDFPFEPMVLKDDYSQKALPRETAEYKNKAGVGTSKSYMYLENEKSSYRHSKDKTITLVVNQGLVNGVEQSVKDTYWLLKADEDGKKGRRAFLGYSYKNRTGKITDSLPIEYKKAGDGVWLLIIENLEPGEYSVYTRMNGKHYTFGID